MKYARIGSDGVVVETFVPLEGFALADCFHPDIASQFVEVPDDVEANWTKQADGSFVAPPPPPEPAEQPSQPA